MTECTHPMTTVEHTITMRDGIRLQTFVHHPQHPAPLPVLLVRSMYGPELMNESRDYYIAHNYIVVVQNVRGRHKSEGNLDGDLDSAEDGYDTMDWIVQQDWCNGSIGTFGASALGRAQTATAALAHPAHTVMHPEVLPFGMNSRLGGTIMYSQIVQWLFRAQNGSELGAWDQVDWSPLFYTLPASDALKKIGGPTKLYHSFLTRETEFCTVTSADSFKKLNTPNCMVTGWYDHCATGAVDYFLLTKKHAPAAQIKKTHLVIGPWDHSLLAQPWDSYDFGDAAKVNHLAESAIFLDYYLKNKDQTQQETPAPVRIFVMGTNEWRDEQDWPLARAVDTPFYLHSAGNANTYTEGGSLSVTAPAAEPTDNFTYDPSNPVPTVGGANSWPACYLPMLRGARDQQSVMYRPDVLIYRSDILTAPMEVTGMLKMVLYAASSARDTDFTAKLMDIRPDGNARILSDGVIRARFRNSHTHAEHTTEELLTPNEIVRYEIDLWFTSNVFLTGHRIGLAVSSSNFPRINRNLNTGGNNEFDSNYISAEQTIFHDAQHPSHLILPVIPTADSQQ